MGHPHGMSWGLLAFALSSCLPSSDLDRHARGSAERPPSSNTESLPSSAETSAAPAESSAPQPSGNGAPATESTPALGPLAMTEQQPAAEPVSQQSADAGSSPLADAGAVPPGSVVEEPPPAAEPPPFAADLPDDLRNAPVSGEIVFSDEAEWEVDGVFEPTFEIRTPTASYWIVKPLGTMVSLEDRAATPGQWIAFSSGFRPLRGVPAFAEPPATRVTTVRDEESTTPTHVRLTSVSLDGAWQWVWDFYITHATFTINRAPGPIGFNYRGVPGGSLGTEDQLVLSDGTAQGARNSFSGDLPGPSEWAYLADTTLGRSLFLIQHRDDALAERYQVRDNDSAFFTFGNGQLTSLPLRFSLGLIASTNHATVSARASFVVAAIPER
jgi:hypothetical protein